MLSFPLDVFFDVFDARPFGRSKTASKEVEGVLPKLRPVAHVAEEGDNFVAEFLMPGVNSSSLKVKVVDDELCIEGERTGTKRKQWHGKIAERLALTPEVDSENIEANYRDGVLSVVLPKKIKRAKVKEITIG